MGGKKGGKRTRPKQVQNYAVVQQSYEDKDYEDAPKPVLVPAESLYRKNRGKKPLFRFGEDMPEDFSEKRNMLMVDDEGGEDREDGKVFFEDEVEEDFDQDFIKEMMYGEGDGDIDSEAEKLAEDEDKYPKHEGTRLQDKQFGRMMREFAIDEDIDEDDPRVLGPLDVMDYAGALEEFVEQHAGTSYTSELPLKHRGLINQMKAMTNQHNVFDTDGKGGRFLTTLLPDKETRMNENFHRDTQDLKEITREMLRRQAESGEGETEAAQQKPQGDSTFQMVEVRDKTRAPDCETILSSYTTIYNHPNVIGAQRKLKLPSNAAAGRIAREGEKAMEKQAKEKRRSEKHGDPNAIDVGSDDDSEVPMDVEGELEGIDLTVRDRDETKEEKKLRRQLVKQLQRQRREEKKNTKGAYRALATDNIASAKHAKQQKKTISLSAVKY